MERILKILPFGLLALSIVFIFYLLSLPAETRQVLTNEGSMIEDISLVCYFFGLAVSLWFFVFASPGKLFWGEISFVLSFFAMREMDWHLRFTSGMSTMRGRFYFNPDFSFMTRIGFGFYYLVLFFVLIHLVIRYFPFFIAAIKRMEVWALTAAVYVFSFGSAYSIERMLKDVMVFFIPMERAETIEPVFEETFELLAAVLLLLVLLQIKKPLEHWLRSRPLKIEN